MMKNKTPISIEDINRVRVSVRTRTKNGVATSWEEMCYHHNWQGGKWDTP
jgi:hypothetical protein